MDRKSAIKAMVLASGSVAALPSWALGWRAADLAGYESSFTRAERKLIAAIADTLIPSDGTIGALSVGVEKFLIRLIEQCYDNGFNDGIRQQLKNLNDSAEQRWGVPFVEGSQKQREDMLLGLSMSGRDGESEFFEFMKSQAIRGFNTSEEVLVNYHNYVLAPGFYDGCVDV